MRLMPHGHLKEVGVRLFTACGSPPEEADILAAELVESSLMGFDSHGVIRYAEYVDSARSGTVHPGAPVAILRETPSTAVVDCGMNFGIVSAARMVQVVAAKAKETTIACVVSRRCHHVGRLGTWVQKLSARGMFGFAAANSGRHGHMVLPWGGSEGRLSTNPLAWSVPTGGDPITHDMSTSMIAEGKVRHLLQSGGEVPAGSILDAAGNPTTDPRALYGPPRGTILPFGSPSLGYKGFGLALLVEILGSTLAGVAIPKEGEPSGYGNGLFLLAIDPGPLCGGDVFRGLIDDLSAYIRSSPPQPGRQGVIMPGELDLRTRSQRLATGIPVPDGTWKLIREAADQLHVRLPDEAGR